MLSYIARVALGFVLATQLLACADETPTSVPDDESYPAPTTPQSLVAALQAIYNDHQSGASERLEAYAELFVPQAHQALPPYLHQCLAADSTIQDSWGLEEELSRARDLFYRQGAREIFSLELHIEHEPPFPVEPQPPEYAAVRISATNVLLRLMFNPQDGLLVYGGSGDFLVVEERGRWFIAEWREFRPAREGPTAVDSPFCALLPIE